MVEKLNNKELPEIAAERSVGTAKVEAVFNSGKTSWAFSRVAIASLRMVSSQRSDWTDKMVILALLVVAPDSVSASRISLATYVLLKTPNLVVDEQGKDALPEDNYWEVC